MTHFSLLRFVLSYYSERPNFRFLASAFASFPVPARLAARLLGAQFLGVVRGPRSCRWLRGSKSVWNGLALWNSSNGGEFGGWEGGVGAFLGAPRGFVAADDAAHRSGLRSRMQRKEGDYSVADLVDSVEATERRDADSM